ncbi:RNA polymerase sigma factor [Nocardia sp. NPDC003979]
MLPEQSTMPERRLRELRERTIAALEEHFRPATIGYLFAVARKRLGEDRFVEDVVLDCYVKLLHRVVDVPADEAEVALEQMTDSYASRTFVSTVVSRAAIDRVRRKQRESSLDDGELPEPDFGELRTDPADGGGEYVLHDPAAEVVRRDMNELTRAGVGAILMALWNRRNRRAKTLLSLTDQDVEHLALLYRFVPVLYPQGSTRDSDRGMNNLLATHYGVNKGTISRRTTRITNITGLALYLACVLGWASTRPTATDAEKHFDVFDGLSADPSRAGDLIRLRLAGRSLRTSPAHGTRADMSVFSTELATELAARRKKVSAQQPDPSPPQDVGDRAVLTERLHAAETRYADDVTSPYPACVAVCGPHNPVMYRPLEF